jgi:hemerythrin
MPSRQELELVPVHVEWTPRLAVGIEEIDAQHRELFRRIDLFLTALNERRAAPELEPLVRYLGRYVRDHFSEEQRLMAFSGFTELGQHLEEHLFFERAYRELANELAATGATLDLAKRLVALLVGWLERHITVTDRRFGAYLERFRAGRTSTPSA